MKLALREEMNLNHIPAERRGAFIAWSNKWGIFLEDKKVWIEYGPLERHQKVSRTMREMWTAYLKRNLN